MGQVDKNIGMERTGVDERDRQLIRNLYLGQVVKLVMVRVGGELRTMEIRTRSEASGNGVHCHRCCSTSTYRS